MDDNNLALLNKYKIDKELLRTAALAPSKGLGASGGIPGASPATKDGKELNEILANRIFALRAQNMLNQPLGQLELQKETVRRKLESIKKFRADHVVYPSGTEVIQDPEFVDSLLKLDKMADGNQVLSLSLFSRPQRTSIVEQAYTNKQFDDEYKNYSLANTQGLFNPRLVMESRKRMQQA